MHGIWATSGLVQLYIEVFWITFVQLGIFFLYFVFKARQAAVKRIYVVLDACEPTMKRIIHLFAFELGLLLLFCRCQRCAWHRGWVAFGGI